MKRVGLQILAAFGGLIVVVSMFIAYTALQPRTLLSGCLVTSVEVKERTSRSLSSVVVSSSCGELSAARYFEVFITPGEPYDFLVRGWSWETPTILESARSD
mgnify:FL=1